MAVQFFYWNSSFEIGIPEVDAQHRRLVDLVNGLAAAIIEGGELPRVEALIDDLRDYAAQHFADEEPLMASAGLSESEQRRHRASHQGFVERVGEIARRNDLMRSDVSEQVLDFLVSWLVSHILGADRRIAEGLNREPRQGIDAGLPNAVPQVEQLLINALGETERRFRLISDNAPAMIWVCDRKGGRTFVNRAWNVFVGIADEEAGDGDWLERLHVDDRPGYAALLGDLLVEPRTAAIEYRLRRPDGAWGWVLEHVCPRFDGAGAFLGLIASGIDVTAIKRSEEVLARTNRELEVEVARRTAELERLMRTDPLTGIGNRRMLLDQLAAIVERGRLLGDPPVAVFFDLDHFKQVNDRYGHPIGDKVLTRVAGALVANLCRDGIVCRWGGEEFVAVLEATSLDEAVRSVERMRAAIGRIRLAEIPGAISVSAGLAVWGDDASIDAFLARADRALYRAKQTGRDRCVVDLAEAVAA